MRFFAVFLFSLLSLVVQAQETPTTVSGIVVNATTLLPKSNVNVVNINTVKGTTSNGHGEFTIEAKANDTLHFSFLGFESIKVRVTNDWLKNKNTKIRLTEKAYALEEVIINKYILTGYLEVDTKILPLNENFRYPISGLPYGYEAGDHSPNKISRVLGSLFNPADLLYNFFGKKPKEMNKLKEMKKDDVIKNLLASKFDKETLAALLGIDVKEIGEILQRCNYSETFIQTANDLQIMEAISSCYEDYKILKRK
ncbi:MULTISPECIES: carboxypeptidase-like regulatory domain-containing protein [Flavobacterium]|uniref:carboxypeptidase-like regulatory domain-containing protein n=1 Tax=Flavobacterium TaxID=237 RepID=UPI00086F4831|nr:MULTISPECIES: carboxypeptidase-like regulatory domain-containing protein [Flavobacterium]MBN9282898.1 carboxypeptidase-like regulatory domain-containing protein [Flavobacterium sp.]ODS85866.1 MAG: hypothetical protein ABS44_14495 [Chryseobacterium sp. SCN 40-13]OJV67539.1 MAG: hypothetical protein BGO42_16005 [Flavobacterium sp. 40-81]